MDKIELDHRDRKNLYREDPDNVFGVTVPSDEIEEADASEALSDAAEHLARTGQRFAYVVIKVER